MKKISVAFIFFFSLVTQAQQKAVAPIIAIAPKLKSDVPAQSTTGQTKAAPAAATAANTTAANATATARTTIKPLATKALRSPASVEGMDRYSFYMDLRGELDKSLKGVAYSRVEKTVKLDNLVAASQDPWTLSNSTKETNLSTDPVYRELLSTLTLKYENQKGFTFQAYGDFYDSSNLGTSRGSRSNYGVSLSQDLVALFKKSSFVLNQEIVEMQGKAKLIASEEAYLSEVLKVADLSYSLFSSICKKQDLEKIYVLATETMQTGDAQHAARTISTRDFLRIRGTYLGVQRQIQAAAYEIATAQNQFSAISQAAFERAVTLSQAKLACEEDMNILKTLDYPKKEEMGELVKKYPSILSIEISKETVKKKFDTFKAGRDVKIQLTGGYDKFNNTVPDNSQYQQSYVGVTISYQFQGELYGAYKQSVAEQYQDLSIRQKQTVLAITNYLNDLYNQIDYQVSQVPLVQSTVQNASRLLKIIETQQSIGQLDATAIDSAYQAEIAAQTEKRSLWASISSVAVKLSEIRKTAEQSASIR